MSATVHYPLSAVVAADELKLALCLAAVDGLHACSLRGSGGADIPWSGHPTRQRRLRARSVRPGRGYESG
ncbi:hypothetical protein ACLI38_34210, partial [Pseudomonas aeruginosa]